MRPVPSLVEPIIRRLTEMSGIETEPHETLFILAVMRLLSRSICRTMAYSDGSSALTEMSVFKSEVPDSVRKPESVFNEKAQTPSSPANPT